MKYLYTLFIASLSFAIANGQTLHEAEPNLDGTFGGAVHNHHFNVPVGSEGWAGYANNNTSIYPLSFVNGGKITFTASASADTTVRFRFEANPYPNVDPAYDTASTAITAAEATYEIAIPASANTYNSALFYVEAQGVDVFLKDVKYISDDTFTVSKTQDFELSLYPNPVKDIATISSTESVDLIRVFDMTGRIVKQATPNRNNFDLDVANLSKGVYLVKLNAGDKEATTKLIK